uniref:SITS-binding protein-like n=1 Tax=Callorhinchus milii TaxID=7868 RepID=A0A4W3GRP1_CALMI
MARDLCASNRSRFCSHWEGAELHISSHLRSAANTDCYRVAWTPRHCRARIQDCFSMVNVSWFGGASLRSQHWPINRASASSQPFLISDLQEQPSGFGSVLEGYFLGSTGVAVLLDGDLPLHLLIEREKRFCLEPRPDVALSALRYTVCVSHNIRSVHQDVGSLLARAPATAPHTALLGRPVWRWPPATDSTDELKRDLRSFINKLKKHKMPEGVLELSESATLRSAQELSRQWRRRKGTLLWQGLGVAITVSLYSSIDSAQFLSSLREGLEGLWLSVCSPAPGTAVSLASILLVSHPDSTGRPAAREPCVTGMYQGVSGVCWGVQALAASASMFAHSMSQASQEPQLFFLPHICAMTRSAFSTSATSPGSVTVSHCRPPRPSYTPSLHRGSTTETPSLSTSPTLPSTAADHPELCSSCSLPHQAL